MMTDNELYERIQKLCKNVIQVAEFFGATGLVQEVIGIKLEVDRRLRLRGVLNGKD